MAWKWIQWLSWTPGSWGKTGDGLAVGVEGSPGFSYRVFPIANSVACVGSVPGVKNRIIIIIIKAIASVKQTPALKKQVGKVNRNCK
jgi:hypothetical protein